MSETFLKTVGITKKFGDLVAVDHVNLEVNLGEIRGLIGENGSGKSTITSMISGIYSITEGEILVRGEHYHPQSINDARANKIAMIVQEVGTIPELSVADNIFLGDEARFKQAGIFINGKKMREEAKKALSLIGFDWVDPTQKCGSLNFEQRKMIEIARALYYKPDLVIIDETTTALSQDGREMVYKIMKELKEQGKAVLFISHDLPELIETVDVISIMRDGVYIKDITKDQFDEDYIKESMVGRKLEGNYYRSDYDPSHGEKVLLKADNITTKDGTVKNVTLELHEGEILGIGGLSDCGMHELGKALFGMRPLTEGKITALKTRDLTKKETKQLHRVRLSNFLALEGYKLSHLFNKHTMQPALVEKDAKSSGGLTMEDIEMFRAGKAPEGVTLKKFEYPTEMMEKEIKSIADAFDSSIGYISKNRDDETLILPESIKDNICISAYSLLNMFGFIFPGQEKDFSQQQIDFLRIKCTSKEQLVGELSGGNKQKVSFAKWIGNNSKILVFDSPTRGVDVGVKTTMYQLLYLLKQAGYAILIISEEMPELIGMSDNILIMKDGKVTKEFVRSADLRDVDIIKHMI